MTQTIALNAPDIPRASNWPGVISIAAGTFLMVTTEFLPIGLLSQLARDLGVTDGIAGLAVTMPGIVAMIAAPFLTLVVGRADRKLLVTLLTLSILVSNIIAATAPSFTIFLIGRMLLGIGVGGLWSFAVAAGRRLVPDSAGGRATSLISAGISVGTIVGVPAGSIIGSLTDWRIAFAGAAAIGLIVILLQLRLLPRLPVETRMTMGRLLAILKVPMAQAGLVTITFIAAGHFMAYTFLEPFLRTGAGLGDDGVALVLAGYALTGLAGTYLGERLSARGVRMALALSAGLVGAAVLAAAFFGGAWLPASLSVLIWGLAFGAVPVAVQIWMHQAAPSLYEGSAAVLVSIFQVGLSAGAFLGGVLVDASSIQTAFLVSAVVSIVGAAIAWIFGTARSA